MAKKKAPCEFCEAEQFYQETSGHIQLNTEVYPDNELIGISVTGMESGENFIELTMDIPMNYCPVCGRKCGY